MQFSFNFHFILAFTLFPSSSLYLAIFFVKFSLQNLQYYNFVTIMSSHDIYKICIMQPPTSRVQILRPTSPLLRAPKKKQKSLLTQYQHLAYELPNIKSLKTVNLHAQKPQQNNRYNPPAEESFVFRAHHSVQSNRKIIDCAAIPNSPRKISRPQSAMLKKSRKRNWDVKKTRIHKLKESDLMFKQDHQPNKYNDSVAFHKEKCTVVRLIENNLNLEYQPIENEYFVKIFGVISLQGNNYFVVKDFNSTSMRNIVDSFGPSKESLVKKQIRNLICGVIHSHNRGIIHNRLNHDTVFMDKEGNILMDFVKISAKKPIQEQKMKYFHFFAPQFLNKGVVSQSCDVWAIGCLTLYLLLGSISQSLLHPYNSECDASPGSQSQDLKNLRQQRKKYEKPGTKSNSEEHNRISIQISKQAQKFIIDCLKFNPRSRPELSILMDHQFFSFKKQN